MKRLNIFLSLLILVLLICQLPKAFAQPDIGKEKIPQNILPELRKDLEALYSSDPLERASAAIRLRNLRAQALKPAMPFLLGQLHDDAKLAIRGPYQFYGGTPTSPGEEAAKTLGKMGKEALESLKAALGDGRRHVRKSAAVGLGETKLPGAIDPLLALTDTEPYSDVLAAAVEALGKITDPRVVRPLIAALGNEDWDVREAAASAFRSINDTRAVGPLLNLLKDARANKKEVIIQTVEFALGHITKIDGADKDQEWESWWNKHRPKDGGNR